jgi:hypothetical protein
MYDLTLRDIRDKMFSCGFFDSVQSIQERKEMKNLDDLVKAVTEVFYKEQ